MTTALALVGSARSSTSQLVRILVALVLAVVVAGAVTVAVAAATSSSSSHTSWLAGKPAPPRGGGTKGG